MPYFNHSMARSINLSMRKKQGGTTSTSKGPGSSTLEGGKGVGGGSVGGVGGGGGGGAGGGDSAGASKKNLRSMPGHVSRKGAPAYRKADPTIAGKYKFQMSQRKMLFMRSLMRAQIDQLRDSSAAYPVETVPKLFSAYRINHGAVRYQSNDVKIMEAKNVNAPELSLCARVYDIRRYDPKSNMFLKILRHLGRKHPYIIHTWEMFHDKEHVYIFQEYATRGNLCEYLEATNRPVEEKQAALWSKQVYRALDFLGDNAIAHRDLAPIHLVVQPMPGEMWLKLTGFKHSVIYWDANSNDIQFCSCYPADRQKEDGPNFQPPEVYGDAENEQFDPIQADIWSYGANVYYMLAREYPYNVSEPYENIDEEIEHNVWKLEKVSEYCKQFMFALMRANANDRMPFDFIENDPWFQANRLLPNKR